METVNLNSEGAGIASLKAARALRQGNVILYPTDTLYGLGADAFSNEAVDKVYAIKGRDARKPMHAVFADMEMVATYAEINDAAKKLAEKFLPGPLTIILKKKTGLDAGIARGMDTIGIRIPDDTFCIQTAKSLEKPFTATSANLAGEVTALSVGDIQTQLGAAFEYIDLCIDAGTLPMRQPSTVVNLVSGFPALLREGAISKVEIEAALK